MSINQRYKELSEKFSSSIAAFSREIDITKSALWLIIKEDSKPSLNTLIATCKRYPEISLEWLILGKGEMIKHAGKNTMNEPEAPYGSSVVDALKNQLEVKDKQLAEMGQQNTKLLELLNIKLSK